MKLIKYFTGLLIISILAIGINTGYTGTAYKANGNVELVTVFKDTVSNSIVKTGFVYPDVNRIVDSVQFVIRAIGEIDVDRLILTKNINFDSTVSKSVNATYSAATGDTTTLTIDNAAGVVTTIWAVTKTVSGLTGANGIRWQVDAASSGNDATDPNRLWLFAIIYYRAE